MILFLSIKVEVGLRGYPCAGTNGEKWPKCPKIQFSGKRRENGVVIAWSSFFSIDIIATAPCDNSFVNKSGGGITNGEKWPKIEFLGKCRENGVVIACSSFLFPDFVATAPSGSILVNKSKGGIKVSPMSRHKWGKMVQNY